MVRICTTNKNLQLSLSFPLSYLLKFSKSVSQVAYDFSSDNEAVD